MRRKKPALQSGRQHLRLGVKDKTSRKQQYYPHQHIGGFATHTKNSTAEYRKRINKYPHTQEYFKHVLKRDMTDIVPAINKSRGGGYEPSKINNTADVFLDCHCC